MGWQEISIALAKAAPYIGVGSLVSVALASAFYRRRIHRQAVLALKEAIETESAEPTTLHPEIDPARCAGCGACVQACPEGEIIQLINHRAMLVQPTKCVGHGECEKACPFEAITLVFGTKRRGMELPRLTKNFETSVKGVYIAGELGGMGLIRNAVKQGRLAATHAIKTLPRGQRTDVDLFIAGAGAAGLTAALTAIAARRSYLCVEQYSVGGTIYNFPRQKIVMTHPAELPIVGKMKFPQNKVTKESLLGFWHQVRRRTGLKVKEGVKFLGFEPHGDVFRVKTTAGTVTAGRVILCLGVRGTPRKLGVPGEHLPKVTYNLLEPEQYRGMHLAVVGGGNAAAEAVQQLAAPELRNKVTMLVRGKALNRANKENQDKTIALAKARRIKLCYETTIKEIHPDHIIVDQRGKLAKLKNHYVFIFAGAEMPFDFLKGLGIKIEKKFGEARK